MEYTSVCDFNEYNFLCHHGVLGMKWGIRRYQPYPSGKHGKFLGKKSLTKKQVLRPDYFGRCWKDTAAVR